MQPADIYAVSLVCFYLLTKGRHPFFNFATSQFDMKKQIASNWDFLEAEPDIPE